MPRRRRRPTQPRGGGVTRAAALVALAVLAVGAVHLSAWGAPAAATTTTVAGDGTVGFAGDGGPGTTAQLGSPAGVAVDGAGNVIVADTANHRIRRVDAATGVITTIAGDGKAGSAGDGGPAARAQLSGPAGVAVDGMGNLVIADTANHRIRRVDAATGVITTIAGDGTVAPVPAGAGPTEVGAFGGDDGPAVRAQLSRPAGVAVDGSGNLVIADTANHRIRRLDAASGVITTIAGDGQAGFAGDDGPGASARLSGPAGVAVSATGRIVIADTANHRIRRLDPTVGLIMTIAGDDFGPSESAAGDTQVGPRGVAVGRTGVVFVANTARNRIDRVEVPVTPGAPVGNAPDTAPPPGSTSACDLVGAPDRAAGTVSVSTPTAVPGQELALQGDGFTAGDRLTVTLCSVPRLLGAVTADPAGRYQARVRIPADAALGSHHLVISDGHGNAAVALTVAQAEDDGMGISGRGGVDGGVGDETEDTVEPLTDEELLAEAELQDEMDELLAEEAEAEAGLDDSGIPTTGGNFAAMLKVASLSLISGLVLVHRARRSRTT